jgi:hypothetical protein
MLMLSVAQNWSPNVVKWDFAMSPVKLATFTILTLQLSKSKEVDHMTV